MPVAANIFRESRRSTIPIHSFHVIPTPAAAANAGSGERTEPGLCGARRRPRPLRSYSGAIVVGRLGVSHHEGASVAPQPAARAIRIGAVVGCGDVQLARDAIGELAMEATVAVRHIGAVANGAAPVS
jgi:hypothetical protein